MKFIILLLTTWLCTNLSASAGLVINLSEPKSAGNKVIVGMELENTYKQKIELVRAVVFLVNDEGKVVGQSTRWIIGGSKDRPALAPSDKAKFNFVVTTDKPFAKAKLVVSRITLEDGKLGNVKEDVEIKEATKDGKETK